MPKMPCSISDGPTYDDWLDEGNKVEPDPDEAYERQRQEEVDREHAKQVDRLHADTPKPTLHTKVSKYTQRTLYSYDQAYWWSTEETALRMFMKLRGTNDE